MNNHNYDISCIIRTEGKTCSGQGVSTVSCRVVCANFLVITFVNWPRQQQFPPKWPPTLQHLRSGDRRLGTRPDDGRRTQHANISTKIWRQIQIHIKSLQKHLDTNIRRTDTLKLNLNLCNCSRCVGRGCKEQCRTFDHLEIVVAADISFHRRRAGAGRGTWRGMGRG